MCAENVTITITCSLEDVLFMLGADREEAARRLVSALLGSGPEDEAAVVVAAEETPLPEIVVDALCRECEGPVDPLTRRHLHDGGDDCRHDDVPEQDLDVALECPACGGQEIAEVNVGEIWDEVTRVAFEAGVLTLTVDQLSEIDRNGDGWVCARCTRRLRLPLGYAIGFEYE